tara:strand:- start:33425 stop:34189 length:765 start_codon:yes stop_codon:yes gene_type:complete
MDDILPLFKSQYSLGRSILTLEKAGSSEESGPDSIVDIAVENNLSKIFMVEDSMSGFLQAYDSLSEKKIDLVFGLRVTVCPTVEEKSEDAVSKSSKYVILCKNTEGYQRLIKIASDSHKLGFYYVPRVDFQILEKYWDNNDLQLCIPFYDSFIYKNLLTSSICVPNFDFTEPTFFLESNDLPFDYLVEEKVKSYCEKNDYNTIKTKSIYYKDKKDFKAYLTFRCINNRSTLSKPELEHMCSDQFCMESWSEKNA